RTVTTPPRTEIAPPQTSAASTAWTPVLIATRSPPGPRRVLRLPPGRERHQGGDEGQDEGADAVGHPLDDPRLVDRAQDPEEPGRRQVGPGGRPLHLALYGVPSCHGSTFLPHLCLEYGADDFDLLGRLVQLGNPHRPAVTRPVDQRHRTERRPGRADP